MISSPGDLVDEAVRQAACALATEVVHDDGELRAVSSGLQDAVETGQSLTSTWPLATTDDPRPPSRRSPMNPPAPTDVIDRLGAALATTGTVVDGIPATRWDDATPCPDWDVRTLTNHLVGGLRIFTAQLTGADSDREHEDDWLGDEPAAAYADAAAAVLAAWRAPGAMDRTLRLSLGPVPAPLGAVIELTEVVVHGLDLAVATGQTDRVDEAQAAALHQLMLGMGFDAFRIPGVFGAPVDVADTAPPPLRLLAFVGRDVAALGLDARSGEPAALGR